MVSGGTIATASRCGPTAMRTSPKSSSVLRRSHMPAGRGDRPQRVRLGVAPLQRGALLRRGPPGPLAHLGQVAHVVAALGVELGLLLAAAAGELADRHAQHGDAEQAAGHHHAGVVLPARNRGGSEVERLLCHQCNRSRRLYDRCPMWQQRSRWRCSLVRSR